MNSSIKLPKELMRSYFGSHVDPQTGNLPSRNFSLDRTSNKYQLPLHQDVPYFGYTHTEKVDIHNQEDYLINYAPLSLGLVSPFNIIYYNIDTRERNLDQYPNSNSFTIELNNKYTIIALELVDADIIKTQYNVNSYNNIFYFEETYDITLSIIIPPGNYTITQLISILQDSLNNTGTSGYLISVNNGKIIITSDITGGSGIFNIQGNSSLLPLLGFKRNINKSNNNSYTSDYTVHDTIFTPNTVLLHIDNISNMEPFLITLGKQLPYNIIHILKGQASTINKLDIRITNTDGSLYENNNSDFSLYLKFKCKN